MIFSENKHKIVYVGRSIPGIIDYDQIYADEKIFDSNNLDQMFDFAEFSNNIICALIPSNNASRNTSKKGLDIDDAYFKHVCVYTVIYIAKDNASIHNLATFIVIPSIFTHKEKHYIASKVIGNHKLNINCYFHLMKGQNIKFHNFYTNIVITRPTSAADDDQIKNPDDVKNFLSKIFNKERYDTDNFYEFLTASNYDEHAPGNEDLLRFNNNVYEKHLKRFDISKENYILAYKIFRGFTRASPIRTIAKLLDLVKQ